MRSKRGLETTAYHAAGHAVIAIHLGVGVSCVEIEGSQTDSTLGSCTYERVLTERDVESNKSKRHHEQRHHEQRHHAHDPRSS